MQPRLQPYVGEAWQSPYDPSPDPDPSPSPSSSPDLDPNPNQVAARLYSLRLSRSVVALVDAELEAAGQRLHPAASQRLEAAVGADSP